MSSKSGFTLAEVLITLGLIGVISAMTIPNLAYNYKAKVLEQQFRSTYSDITQMSNMISRSNGDIGIYANKVDYKHWISTFMSNVSGGSELKDDSGGGDVAGTLKWYYQSTGTPIGPFNFYPRKYAEPVCDDGGVWVDSKGRLWTFNEKNALVCVDINGSAAPNRFNIDTFVFIPMSGAQVGEWLYDDVAHANNYTGQMVLCDITFIYANKLADVTPTDGFEHKGKGSVLDACPFNGPLENVAPLDRESNGKYKTYGIAANGIKTTSKDDYWNTYIHYK